MRACGMLVWGLASTALVVLLAAIGDGPAVAHKAHEIVALGAVATVPATGRSLVSAAPSAATP